MTSNEFIKLLEAYKEVNGSGYGSFTVTIQNRAIVGIVIERKILVSKTNSGDYIEPNSVDIQGLLSMAEISYKNISIKIVDRAINIIKEIKEKIGKINEEKTRDLLNDLNDIISKLETEVKEIFEIKLYEYKKELERYLNYLDDYFVRRKSLPESVRNIVLEKYQRKCCMCLETSNLEIDHIKSVAEGGNSDVGNLQVLCHECHMEKHSFKKRKNYSLTGSMLSDIK